MRVSLPYGSDQVAVDVPDSKLLEILTLADQSPAIDPASVIQYALRHPIDSPELSTLARGMSNAVVLVDDITRPTPTHLILPHVIEELMRAGIVLDKITILIALGTHRKMTNDEISHKLGAKIVNDINVVQHDYRDKNSLVNLGRTESGIPVVVNRLVCDSDLVVAIGNIVPHRYCGWAGGAKIIQPGVSGEATTAGTHLMITKDPGARLGTLENQVRHEIESVADQTTLRFIVNTILTRTGDVFDVVAGDFRMAFREGVKRAQAVYAVNVHEQAEIVLTSGYPADLNFWQAGKALYAADLVVRDGGIIVLASPCTDGMGEHPEFNHLLRDSYTMIERRLRTGQVQDQIGAAAALAVAKVRERSRVFLVADGVSEQEARIAGLEKFTSVQEAVNTALQQAGPSARLSVLTEGAEALPIIVGK